MRIILLYIFILVFGFTANAQVYFTSGIKIGEVSDTSAILLTRLSAQEKANPVTHERRNPPMRHPIDFDNDMPIEKMDGAVKGQKGMVRFILKSANEEHRSKWIHTVKDSDFIAKNAFTNLKSNTLYKVEVQGKKGFFSKVNTTLGEFSTAPANNDDSDFNFTVSTCQYFWDFDDPIRGFKAYDHMRQLKPAFHCQTGDYVYYDKPGPLAYNIDQARHKWSAINAWPSLEEFYRYTPLYIQKDDHDVLDDDANPYSKPYGKLTFEEGIEVWYEQNPIERNNPYRTFRWGKSLQLWFVEGRESRSDNKDPDSESKTILGKEQKDWLVKTMNESDATIKLLISPTPIVGPDRAKGKNDNHSNKAFAIEGDWLRELLAEQQNVFVICGDRHWQYVSQDLKTGLMEFSSGATSDEHAQGWNPEDVMPEHQFLRVKGGFLGVSIKGCSEIVFDHYDVDGNIVNSVTKSLR
ncbi:alkaline phosphatase D [Spirosomataceae bacterium TFI 002]|nr:alkaline phosphatase D [Spirosomataceae bacterium TFI 002]